MDTNGAEKKKKKSIRSNLVGLAAFPLGKMPNPNTAPGARSRVVARG